VFVALRGDGRVGSTSLSSQEQILSITIVDIKVSCGGNKLRTGRSPEARNTRRLAAHLVAAFCPMILKQM